MKMVRKLLVLCQVLLPQALQQNQGKLEPACLLLSKYQTKKLYILEKKKIYTLYFSVFLCPPWSTHQDRTQHRVLPQVTPSLLYALWCYNNEFVFPLLPCLTVTCSLLKQSAFYSSVSAVQTQNEHGRAPGALGPGAPCTAQPWPCSRCHPQRKSSPKSLTAHKEPPPLCSVGSQPRQHSHVWWKALGTSRGPRMLQGMWWLWACCHHLCSPIKHKSGW